MEEDESLLISFQKKRLRSCHHEKIVLLIDKHDSLKTNEGWNNDDNDNTILDSICSYVNVFIKRKLKTFYKHEIALVSFDNNKVILNSNFTSNEKMLTNSIKNINDDNGDIYVNINDDSNLNEIINHTIGILGLNSNGVNDDDNKINVRFILIYGRNKSLIMNNDDTPSSYLFHPSVYFDILYLHGKVTKEDQEGLLYQEIFDNLATFQLLISESNRNYNNDKNAIDDGNIEEEKINYIFDSHNSSLRINTYIAGISIKSIKVSHILINIINQ
jgi:hypothetical protein